MRAPKRRYDSSRRRNLMAAGHRRILEAARPLFRDGGFAAVSVEEIAAAAGVAVPTIYAAYGSKRGVMSALLGESTAVAAGPGADGTDPEEQLRAAVAAAVQTFERDADLLEACRTSGDAQLIDLWNRSASRRHEAAADLVRQWSEAGALAARLTEAEALDVFEALAGPEAFRRLVGTCGWTPERYVQWLYELLRWELFGRYRGLRRPA